ncbi:MAG: ATP-binding protein [Proteobacteria bacterium]|nr:ATP-binding protein [Pseudomonadota bacterium]
MDIRFLPHNTHLDDPKRFAEKDPQLRQLKNQPYQHSPALLEKLPFKVPGIYTLGGGRQIGKTTLLKLWMARLLGHHVLPQNIAFFSGELINDYHSLLHLIQAQLMQMSEQSIQYLIIDEITYIPDWDKAVKYAADAGLLENTVLMLTGSDLTLMQEARMRFPGRRGTASVVNFHLYPLSFYEVVKLKGKIKNLDRYLKEIHVSNSVMNLLFEEFQNYLLHGGYLTAINDMAKYGRILESTLMTYSDWIRGDMMKRGKQEHYLREILNAIIKRYNSQLTWNSLASDLSIDHPKTVADYAALLESMDALFIQAALLEDKLTAAPKKARKVVFTDPFIFHALRAWLHPVEKPFETQIMPYINDPEKVSKLVEACVATHYRRFYPTYYIKAEAEVDIAYIDKERFWPIEIKWTNQTRMQDFKQIIKYKNARILTKSKESHLIHQIQTEPLALALIKVGNS